MFLFVQDDLQEEQPQEVGLNSESYRAPDTNDRLRHNSTPGHNARQGHNGSSEVTGDLTIMVHAEDVSFQTDYEYIPNDIGDTSSDKLEPEKTLSDTNVQHNL